METERNDSRKNDARTVWQLQRTDAASIDIADIRRRALKFQGQIWRRNRCEYVASILVVVLFSLWFWRAEGVWTRAGALLVIAGTFYVAWQLYRRGSSQAVPSGVSVIVFHRAELERQRDALQDVWRWYLLPFVPGLMVFHLGSVLDDPPVPWSSLLVYPSILVALFYGIFKLNQWAARELQRELDELAELE